MRNPSPALSLPPHCPLQSPRCSPAGAAANHLRQKLQSYTYSAVYSSHSRLYLFNLRVTTPRTSSSLPVSRMAPRSTRRAQQAAEDARQLQQQQAAAVATPAIPPLVPPAPPTTSTRRSKRRAPSPPRKPVRAPTPTDRLSILSSELLALILSHLSPPASPDLPSLFAFSLVSRSLLPHVRAHMYRELRIDTRVNAHALHRTLHGNDVARVVRGVEADVGRMSKTSSQWVGESHDPLFVPLEMSALPGPREGRRLGVARRRRTNAELTSSLRFPAPHFPTTPNHPLLQPLRLVPLPLASLTLRHHRLVSLAPHPHALPACGRFGLDSELVWQSSRCESFLSLVSPSSFSFGDRTRPFGMANLALSLHPPSAQATPHPHQRPRTFPRICTLPFGLSLAYRPPRQRGKGRWSERRNGCRLEGEGRLEWWRREGTGYVEC